MYVNMRALARNLVLDAIQRGGVTISYRIGSEMEYGYAVGGRCKGLIFPEPKSPRVLTERIGQVSTWIGKNPSPYYGSWLDDGKVYIDAIDIVENLVSAISLGRERGEIAIYDLGDGKEIRLEEEGGALPR